MISTRKRLAASAAIAATSVASLGLLSPAHASSTNPSDPADGTTAVASDLVGVGSDTSQIALHYLAEGQGSTKGFNDGKSAGRIVSFAADGTPATISLRGGAAITRPNGSGAGKGLLYGAGDNADVTFARSSSALNPAEANAGLKAFPFAVDGLKLAVSSSSTNAPATISDADVVRIYKGEVTNWNQIGGKNGTIAPLIPQAGSGTRSFFAAQLKARNGGVDVTPGPAVKETQENDDKDIKGNPNAVAPYSTGRAQSTSTIKLENGFSARRALYNVVRGSDATSTAITGVFGESGFVCSPAARPLIEAAGFVQLATPSVGGVCGQATSGATTNFLAAGSQASTTTLAGQATPNGVVTLQASVAPAAVAEGKVEFFETGQDSSTSVAGPVEVDSLGNASATLTGVQGSHTYRATFTPTDPQASTTSSSSDTTVIVPNAKYDVEPTITVPASTYGATRKATVTVANENAVGTGSVRFAFGQSTPATKDLDANGQATFDVPADTPAGTYYTGVTYSGDSNFERTVQLGTFSIAKATTTTTLSIKATKVKVKKTTPATVTVVLGGSTIKANGKVTLKIGSSTVGTGTVKDGKATVTIKASTKTGAKKVKATFTPTGSNYSGSTSNTDTYTVVK